VPDLGLSAAEKGGAHCIALNAADEWPSRPSLKDAFLSPQSRVQLNKYGIDAGGAPGYHRGRARRGQEARRMAGALVA